jgi:hypothetical protein
MTFEPTETPSVLEDEQISDDEEDSDYFDDESSDDEAFEYESDEDLITSLSDEEDDDGSEESDSQSWLLYLRGDVSVNGITKQPEEEEELLPLNFTLSEDEGTNGDEKDVKSKCKSIYSTQ